MTLFEEIISEILVEDISIGKVNDAIDRTYEVKINYHSDNDNASGERIIQPVAYGLTKKGNPVIRAYQPYGDTQTKVPAWKFFLLSGIKTWKPLFKNTFRTPADGFNPNDDKTMSVVYKIAKFWDTHNKKEEDIPTTKGPVKKTDIENKKHYSVKDNDEVKKMEKLRKQLENPKYLSDFINKEKEVSSGPVIKDDNDPNFISVKDNPELKKLEKLKKQLDNPKYISDIIKNKTLEVNPEEENNKMTADSGPITTDSLNNDNFMTQTEKDINSRQNQLNKNEKVPQSVLDQWKKEQEKKKNRYGSNRNGISRSIK